MPVIIWDIGTAYDFFVSLIVLHNAADFGLRPSWTAGVRQRLSSPSREFFERLYLFSGTGLEWLSGLPLPKDALDVLRLAADLKPAARFETLTLPAEITADVRAMLRSIASRRLATTADREYLQSHYIQRGQGLTSAGLDNLVAAWSALDESGDRLLASLREYHQVFFSDEEARLRPSLERGLAYARDLSARLDLDSLIESLSNGVRIEDISALKRLILAPSYWTSPLVFHVRPRAGQALVVFGVRPSIESLAPGAETPDQLVMALKCLADPTRLRILRYLSREFLPPAEMARRLRLRSPTVIHHLNSLRLAGLVHITVNENNEKRYAARLERLKELNESLQEFLIRKDEHG